MQHFAFIFLFLMAEVLHGQEKMSVSDIVPDIFFAKQDLIEHYQVQKLSYDDLVADLEKKANEHLKIIAKNGDQIICQEINRGPLDTITYVLTFNSNKQIVKWECDFKDCYNRYGGSDVPEPFISTLNYNYHKNGQIEQISGHCTSKEFSTLQTFYYNKENKLDSIISQEGSMGLIPYRKIIFIDTTLISGALKSSMALVINTQFDYTKWLKVELNDTSYFKKVGNEEIGVRRSLPIKYNLYDGRSGNNYVYEFDSLGKITSLRVLDADAAYTPIVPCFGCEICDETCESPSMLEFHYENNKISGIELTSVNRPNAENKCRCSCLIYITYRKEKIKEIHYYAGLNDERPKMHKKWTERKGFQKINETADKSK